jgi:hypothetical protein
MEKMDPRLDHETWLTVFVPGAVVVATAYLALAGARQFANALLAQVSDQAQPVLVIFLGAAVAALAGMANHCISRWLYRCQFPWGWMRRRFGDTPCADEDDRHGRRRRLMEWLMRRSPWFVVRGRFYGELLPYIALSSRRGPGDHFIDALRAKIEALAGPVGSGVGSQRHYDHVASDLVKAWVLSEVGKSVSAEAWRYASRFRQLSDAYVAWATALPLAAIVCLGAGMAATTQVSAHWLIATLLCLELAAGAAAAVILYWWCTLEVLTNWYQWQNELSRIFFAAWRSERPAVPR